MNAFSEVVSPAPLQEWDEVLSTNPHASAFQSPQWTGAMCDAGPYADASRLYRTHDGRRLVLPLVRRRETSGRLGIRWSLPRGWGYGGLLADGEVLHLEDIRLVCEELDRGGLATMVTPNPTQDRLWASAGVAWSFEHPVYEHALDLTCGFDEIWQHRFRSSVRRAVRKAEHSGVTVERDTTGRLIPEFERLYWMSVPRWAGKDSMPDPIARSRVKRGESGRKFAVVAGRLEGSCVTWLASHGGRPVAGIIVVTHGRTADYWRGAMDIEHAGPVRANDLLQKLAIEEACDMGVERYSFGFGGSNSADNGLVRFKRGFGAQPVTCNARVLERLPLMRTAADTRRLVRRGFSRLTR